MLAAQGVAIGCTHLQHPTGSRAAATVRGTRCCNRVRRGPMSHPCARVLNMTQHSPGQRVGYARVSSTDQNLARQIDIIGDVHRTFEEKVSGASRDGRTALADLIAYVREGDTVVVSEMSRLARSVVDLNQIVAELTAKGVRVEFITERVTFSPGTIDPYSEFQLNLMASFAQLERAITRERQADGIKAAMARGVYKGGKPKLTAAQVAKARELIAAGVPKTKVARDLGVERTTLYRHLKASVSSSMPT